MNELPDKRKLFSDFQKKYGFEGIKQIVLLGAEDVLTRFEGGKPYLDSIEKSTTYNELFTNLKKKIPELGNDTEMIYFLLVGAGLYEREE